MARDFRINGEALVTVKGGEHLSGFALGSLTELGLTTDEIRVVPRYYHRDLRVDDYGSDVPAETLGMLADCTVRMTLIHYDDAALSSCLRESAAGGRFANVDGRFNPAGTPMGNYCPLFASGCHYISLNVLSPQGDLPWRFPTSYMTGPPVEVPLGTKASAVMVNWRAIPYRIPSMQFTDAKVIAQFLNPDDPKFAQAVADLGRDGFAVVTGIGGEIISSGAIVWDHERDV